MIWTALTYLVIIIAGAVALSPWALLGWLVWQDWGPNGARR